MAAPLRPRPRVLPHHRLRNDIIPPPAASPVVRSLNTLTAASAARTAASTSSSIPTATHRHTPRSHLPWNAALHHQGRRASPEAALRPHHPSNTLTPNMLALLPRTARLRPFTTTRPFKNSSHLLDIISGSTSAARRNRHDAETRARSPQIGLATPYPSDAGATKSKSPYYFEAGYAGWAKRPSRPFPPPFFSPPSGSFSDPLSTHNRASDRRQPRVHGQFIRGVTNGDDALLVSDNLIGTNDGVGAWAQRERGHAPLWSRLLMHFLIMAAEKREYGGGEGGKPDPVGYLDEAYTATKEALSPPNNEWLGTTTACFALLDAGEGEGEGAQIKPVLYVTQVGDCKCLVIRPNEKEVLFGTEEQWHYFDCPRQLGTNSPDTPFDNAVLSRVELQEDDMVLAMSDGVTDNLWEGEIVDSAVDAMKTWEEMQRSGKAGQDVGEGGSYAEGMRFVAQELVLAARKIAEDPFAASPFMERAVDEGLAIEGGKLDDISVVAALCKKRKG